MTFENCVEIILKHEGGYSNSSLDPGLETRFGISKRAYPNLNVHDLNIDQAKTIYRLDYWDATMCDKLNPAIRLMVFDCAINQGKSRAIIYLQKCAGVITDGVIGPITLDCLAQLEPEFIISKMAKYRHDAYSKNPRWPTFGAGWSSRLLDITIRSLVFLGALNLAKERNNLNIDQSKIS